MDTPKYVIKIEGADHPWLPDSDEDDDDYKKAEDDFVYGRQESDGELVQERASRVRGSP